MRPRSPLKPRSRVSLDALILAVRPFELDRVVAELLGLPGAYVADLAVVVVVPALAGDRVRDGLAQLVRAGGGQRVDGRETARAALAPGIRHRGVEDLPRDVVVVAAECLAGGRSALD